MKQLADGIWRLDQRPRPMVNVYLAGDLLIDAGSRVDRRRILRQIDGVELSMLALTHVHPDHQGVAKEVCEGRGIPLACHAADAPAMQGERSMMEVGAERLSTKLTIKWFAGPPCRIERPFADGEEIGGFRAVHTPGHSRGHTVYFRESDRIAVCGDVVRNMTYLTTRSGIREPPDAFTYDPAENRRSIRRLAELNPSLLLPGHGPPITDVAAFERFVAALPAD